jgi:hypothetical protein
LLADISGVLLIIAAVAILVQKKGIGCFYAYRNIDSFSLCVFVTYLILWPTG